MGIVAERAVPTIVAVGHVHFATPRKQRLNELQTCAGIARRCRQGSYPFMRMVAFAGS
jgi:hypothetical protein